ncbi:MAG: ABC transporter permease [Chloroflexi bacterium]|nr:ABC transporter permease [Chloroflexota bacterium]
MATETLQDVFQPDTGPDTGQGEESSHSPFRRAIGRLLRKKIAVAAMTVLLILYGAGIFAQFIDRYDPNKIDLLVTQEGPSWDHWLGTDRAGRDIYSRVVWGLQTTVIITLIGLVTGSLVLGVTLGLLAGYYRGWFDVSVMRFGEVVASFPDVLLIILIAATLRPRIINTTRDFEDWSGIDGIVSSGAVDFFVVGVALLPLSWFGMMRLVRGQVLSLRAMPFVESAQAIGVSTPRMIFSHLLPNVIGPIIVTASFGLGAVAGSEIFLSFLGLGVQPPRPSLGFMINDVTSRGAASVSVLQNHPEQLLAPIAVIWALIFCWNLLGDALNDVFNPRTR